MNHQLKLLSIGIWLLLFLAFARIAAAHDGGPRVLLNLYQIAPGQTLQVQGINLGTDLLVKVAVVGEETAVFLGEALCDGHGDFVQQFALPTTLPIGIYAIQAIDTSVAGQETVMAEARFSISNNPLPLQNQVTTVESNSLFTSRNLIMAGTMLLAIGMFIIAFRTKRKEQNQLPSRPM